MRDRNKLTMIDIVGFYGQLEREHSELLQFKYKGTDKYHIIKAWLTPYAVE